MNERYEPPQTQSTTPVEPTDLPLHIYGKDDAQAIIEEAPAQVTDELAELRRNYEPQELLEAVRGGFRTVSSQIIGREEVLGQTLLALLTREHQLLYSRAGTAKSLLAKTVFNQFGGSRVFSIQMTKGTPEEGLVGPIQIEDLKKGKIIHNTQNTIVDARLAYLDEIFDANDVALRSLLGILNERWFISGGQAERSLLHTAIATSNYVRATDITEAVIDRFAFRAYLLPDKDPYNMLRIDETYEHNAGNVPEPDTKIPFDYVDYLADIVEGKIPKYHISAQPHILFLKNQLINKYIEIINSQRSSQTPKKPELYISPRTVAKTRDVLNASALLHNRDHLTTQDLGALRFMICTIGNGEENQEQIFQQALDAMRVYKRTDLEAVDTLMNVNEILEQMIEAKSTGGKLALSVVNRLKIAFGLQKLEDLTFPQIVDTINNIQPSTTLPQFQLHADVIALKNGIVDRMRKEARHFFPGGKDDSSLFF